MDIPRALIRSGAYRDLQEPVVVTSGEFLTPFFVNAERLCGDPAMDLFLTVHGGSDREVIDHACSLAEAGEDFRAVVEELAARASGLLRASAKPMISGGQRRDWLFSGPVARLLGLPHVSLYKQAPGQAREADRAVVRAPGGEALDQAALPGSTAVHVVDMITAASSCLDRDPASGRDVGWVSMLRDRGVQIRDLVAVVSRRQGGEERLERAGVRVSSLVTVDDAFLRAHSGRPDEAAAYYRGPEEWTRRYLREHGIGLLVPYLSEDAKKLPRLIKLVRVYEAFLRAEGLWRDLDEAAFARLGRGMGQLLGEGQ